MSEQSTDNYQPPEFVAVGRILRPHGVRGEMRVELLTEFPERFKTLEEVYVAKKGRGKRLAAPQLTAVKGSRTHQNKILLKLGGVDDRNAADLLRGAVLYVPFSEVVPLDDGEFYLFELIDMQVFTDQGEFLGKVAETLETGANDVFVVNGGERGTLLIPDTPEVVTHVDRAERRITVHELPGLFGPVKS